MSLNKGNLKNNYKRILELSDDASVITMHDGRFYKRNGSFYPSITTVLQMYPKGQRYEDWLKRVGYASEYIVKKAADEGTLTHNLIEEYLLGKEVTWLYKDGNPKYNTQVWQMFLRFVEFWETYQPKLIETEVHLFSDQYKVAGTCDLIIELDGKRWLLDNKTSNHITPTYEIQCAIYGQCYKECYGIDIDHYGVLWLKSSKRKFNKDKMTGKGWEVVLPTRKFEENLEIFKLLKGMYDIENPKPSPLTNELRTSAKRNVTNIYQ